MSLWRSFGAAALFQSVHRLSDASPHSVLKSLGLHLVMLHNMRPDSFFDLNGSFWSLALEFHLYILFPVFVEALRRFDSRESAAGLCWPCHQRFPVCLAVHLAQTTDDPWLNVLTYSVFGRCLEFLLGMVAAQRLARRAADGTPFFQSHRTE